VKVLADTSVWIDHLRQSARPLCMLLDANEVLMHPAVAGELACGAIINRAAILALLAELPEAYRAADDEVRNLIERRRLYGRGIGWIDAHLLASALLTECVLWTHDKTLATIARELRISSDVV